VTAQGDQVLGRGGRALTVGRDGRVDPRALQLVNLDNPRKDGDSLVAGTPAGAAGGQVRAGALESSGADAARSMVDMIASMRAFEAGQKVIQTIDETLGKASSQVGAVTG
jgi:flagellar basal-body rod protein FlgF